MGTKLRLDKMLSHLGYGSRSEIRKYAKEGRIAVNGRKAKDSGETVDPAKDEVVFDGAVVRYREFIYLMLHKPAGVVSATEDNRDRTVVDLLSPEQAAFEPFPVGRLDKDTEGLLLLTNDGQLAHRLLSPKKHVPKTYYADVAGVVKSEDGEAFARGVTLDDGYVTLPAKLVVLESGPTSRIELTITEGKFHQVKRMFEAVGKKVVYLKRLSMGSLSLDPELPLGAVRELTDEELENLRMGSPQTGQSTQ
ncbi:rRNA pseudouridine synthase [Paenibacillus antri]|uniref:Pseudouridine synthase n=1 Tax=Paenibacillus antri TaxID=2582848 RepID=A0A5R9GL09_9BACL|nr:pseudouridine synthase [Paenibacillus antri]TLS54228.1 rRNA pseudouridine synthase [Paenibacillus antri]